MKTLAALLPLLALVACTRSPMVERDRPAVDATSTQTDPARQTTPAPSVARLDTFEDAEAPASFALVVEGGESLRFTRLAPGLLATNGDVLYALSSQGALSPIEPLVAAMAGSGTRIGGIGGEWPEGLYVETIIGGERSGIRTTTLYVTEHQASLKKARSGHFTAVSRWSEGRLLGFYASGTSELLPGARGWSGSFEVIRGAASPLMPRLPREAAFNGRFVAFDSGRILALGCTRPKASEEPGAYVWDFADAVHPRGSSLPEFGGNCSGGIARGRNEQETLVFGSVGSDPYLARFDGKGWRRIEAPFDQGIDDLSIGVDGSVWAVSGHPSDGISTATLWRADFPDLKFRVVPLPEIGGEKARGASKVVPLAVAANSADDVWLSARRAGSSRTADNLLLHKGGGSVTSLAARDELERIVLNKSPPAAYTSACATPFLLFGLATDMGELEMTAIAEGLSPWPGGQTSAVVGRLHDARVYGIELGDRSSPGSLNALTALLPAARRKFPQAKLVCSWPVVEKTLR